MSLSRSIDNQRSNVQLLYLSLDHNPKIKFNQDAIRNLFFNPQIKDRKVAVFSIVGEFRKGKSFLFSLLLKFLYARCSSLSKPTPTCNENWMGDQNEPLADVFEWKSGVDRVTKGIMFWNDVFLYDGPNDEKYAIYIMDTQGLFDHKTTTSDNFKIFSLSTLISSLQIFNIFNVIQENQLQHLQFATEYARYGLSDSDKSPFQDLLILIRDWCGINDYKYGMRGGNAYLEKYLRIHENQPHELKSVRKYLKSSFENLNCFLMPYPGKTVATDPTFNGQWGLIDEDFVTMTNELFENFLDRIKPKKINGCSINPDEFFVFMTKYVDVLNNETELVAKSIYESTLDQHFRILVAKSMDVYTEAMRSYGEISSEEKLNELHLSSKNKAMVYFNSGGKFGSYSERVNYQKELDQKIEKNYKQWKSAVIKLIEEVNEYKSKANEQLKQFENAKMLEMEAKKKLESTNSRVSEARDALEKAKTDTEEAKLEAQELKRKFEEAQKERADAIEKEKNIQEMLRKAEEEKCFYEQKYEKLKMQYSENIDSHLDTTRNEHGFERILLDIAIWILDAVDKIMNIFK